MAPGCVSFGRIVPQNRPVSQTVGQSVRSLPSRRALSQSVDQRISCTAQERRATDLKASNSNGGWIFGRAVVGQPREAPRCP